MDLAKRKRVLLLAAVDMEQTIEAARAIEREGEREAAGEEPNVQLVRALESRARGCYWRPFTNTPSGGSTLLRTARPRPAGSATSTAR